MELPSLTVKPSIQTYSLGEIAKHLSESVYQCLVTHDSSPPDP